MQPKIGRFLDSTERKVPPLRSSSNTGRSRIVLMGDQCRCACGSLMARVVPEGLEIKCRKCKGLVVISHSELASLMSAAAQASEATPREPSPASTTSDS